MQQHPESPSPVTGDSISYLTFTRRYRSDSLVSIPCHRGLNLLHGMPLLRGSSAQAVSIPCHRGLNLLRLQALIAYGWLDIVSIPCHRGLNLLPLIACHMHSHPDGQRAHSADCDVH